MLFLSRVLQFIGILEVGYGLFNGVIQDIDTGEGGLSLNLRHAMIGGAIFLFGWMIQKYWMER